VEVQFDGSNSSHGRFGEDYGIVSYKWYNQWGLRRAEGQAPTFEVNFGHDDPKPGTERRLQLVVEDTEGNTDEDWVKITLADKADSSQEHTGTITVNPGSEGDYTFSQDHIQHVFETDDGPACVDICGGIIDTDGQDYSYVFVVVDKDEQGGADCHSH
jgi:hypothetical protein